MAVAGRAARKARQNRDFEAFMVSLQVVVKE
jgi:hypothetical protein